MRYEVVDKITDLLVSGMAHEECVLAPEVGHLPHMRSREHFFLLVSMYIKPQSLSREQLVERCLAAARIVVESDLLSDEKALEIAVYNADKGRLSRVVRLSVSGNALSGISAASVADVIDGGREGVLCQWPLFPM